MSVVRARGLLAAAAAGEDARRCQRSGGALRGSPGLVRIMQMGSDGAGTARTVVIY
jgi:hypothetical protein